MNEADIKRIQSELLNDSSFIKELSKKLEVENSTGVDLQLLKDNLYNVINPECGGITAGAVNAAGWRMIELLRQSGDVNGRQFNTMKSMLCETMQVYFEELLKSFKRNQNK